MQLFSKRNVGSLTEAGLTPSQSSGEILDESLLRASNQNSTGASGNTVVVAPPEFRFIYPEFLPDPKPEYRNKLKEKLERIDMLQRRSVIEIPEFYTGKMFIFSVFSKFCVT